MGALLLSLSGRGVGLIAGAALPCNFIVGSESLNRITLVINQELAFRFLKESTNLTRCFLAA